MKKFLIIFALLMSPAFIIADEEEQREDLTHCEAGLLELKRDNTDEAIRRFNVCINIGNLRGDNLAIFHNMLGAIYFEREDYDHAIKDFTQVIKLLPSGSAYHNRGMAYKSKKQYSHVIEDYTKAIELDPDQAVRYNTLSWMLATCPKASCRDGKRAIKLAKQAIQLEGERAYLLATLAAAYAEAGNFNEAIQTQKKVMVKAKEEKWEEMGEFALEAQLQAYQNHKPWRYNPRRR